MKYEKKYCVYIMTNKPRGTLYIGVTGNLLERVNQHKEEIIDGFTKRYHLHKLVYFEEYSHISDAIAREKQLKNWHRTGKLTWSPLKILIGQICIRVY